MSRAWMPLKRRHQEALCPRAYTTASRHNASSRCPHGATMRAMGSDPFDSVAARVPFSGSTLDGTRKPKLAEKRRGTGFQQCAQARRWPERGRTFSATRETVTAWL